MKTIKTYEDFINEEINWRKAAVGTALAGSLLGGLASCKKSDIKPKQETTQSQQTSQSTDLNSVVDVVIEKDSVLLYNLTNKDIKLYQMIVSVGEDTTGQGYFFHRYDIVIPKNKTYTAISDSSTAYGSTELYNFLSDLKKHNPNDYFFIDLFNYENGKSVKVFSYKKRISELK